MWVIKITVPYNKKTLLGNLAKKHSLTFFGYPLSHTLYKNYVRIVTSGYVLGDNVKECVRDLKRSNRVFNMEVHDNFFILDIKQHIANKFLFQPGLVLIKPAMITPKGEYIFEIASWDKEKLTNIFKEYNFLSAKLHSIQKKKITNIQTMNIYPNLTDKQKDALNLAIKRGYYGYPRKIDLKELAKEFGCSYSTYQFHLRNAEKKVMPSLL